MNYRQIFICNIYRCILIRNLDRLRHVKDVTNSRTSGTYISKANLDKKKYVPEVLNVHMNEIYKKLTEIK